MAPRRSASRQRLRRSRKSAKPGHVDLLGAAGGVEAGGLEQRSQLNPVSRGERLQAGAASLRRCPERGGSRAAAVAGPAQSSGIGRGISCTTEDVTFGGGVKARGAHRRGSAPARASRASTAEPPVVLAFARRRDDALGDLALEHQGQPVEPRRPVRRQPADQQRRGDVVGQVGADPRRRAGRRVATSAARSTVSASPAMISSRPG